MLSWLDSTSLITNLSALYYHDLSSMEAHDPSCGDRQPHFRQSCRRRYLYKSKIRQGAQPKPLLTV